MEIMTVTTLDSRREWTRDDLDRLPEGDGLRYEIIDGLLVVNAAPRPRHQMVLAGLYDALRARCPAHLVTLFAPLDVVLDERTVLQPDLLVARRDQFDDTGLRERPELAVEVLSPSSRGVDRLLKFERYQRAATPAYWLVDPDSLTLDAYELRADTYELLARVTGDQTWAATMPYAVDLTPSSWLA
ncbi:Uma2 family endonuclease [Piscicoccus intestinalis]|uniref:Uma2 family endonuclease n=1 Tax=Piscicoccus intestinalis TaxID=746033 RepID=UPI0012ED9850|nr:Uma2 family endonuclease [Piscicoccus intestinalis]